MVQVGQVVATCLGLNKLQTLWPTIADGNIVSALDEFVEMIHG